MGKNESGIVKIIVAIASIAGYIGYKNRTPKNNKS